MESLDTNQPPLRVHQRTPDDNVDHWIFHPLLYSVAHENSHLFSRGINSSLFFLVKPVKLLQVFFSICLFNRSSGFHCVQL